MWLGKVTRDVLVRRTLFARTIEFMDVGGNMPGITTMLPVEFLGVG